MFKSFLERSVCQGDGSFDTLQEYIFTLLNRHQRLKELLF